MKRFKHFAALGSYLALACSTMTIAPGCAVDPAQEEATAEGTTISIRLHEGVEKRGELLDGPQTLGLMPLLAAGEYTDVTDILVDVTYADSGQAFAINFALTQKASNVWEGNLPFLPRDVELKFAARALEADGTQIFSGDTLATLTVDNQAVEIPLAPAQNDGEFDMPRMFRIAYPSEVIEGQEVQVIFTVEGNAGETIDYEITSADGSSPFSPAAGSITLGNTVADFVAIYTAPEVGEENETFDHEVVITSADSLSAVSIATSFTTTVVPEEVGIPGVTGTVPSVLFNPVVLGLEADGTAIPNAVALEATVSDDGLAENLTYAWSYEPNSGTTDTTFVDNTVNPATLQNYTVDLQGTIHFSVTDENAGTTTLHYQLLPNQFADAINHDAVDGFKKMVTGNAHTCVLTSDNKVRCWGDASVGQLGYGNTLDVGATTDRLPHDAGDVDLPEPVRQLVAGYNHTCVLLDSGLVYCWGRNDNGQLGYGHEANLGDGEAVTSFGYVSLGGLATKIAAGGDHTCAILEDSGALRCWGRNNYGQLGRGHTNDIGDDELVYTAGNVNVGATVADMALGYDHTCVLLDTGNVRCWGRGTYGQLGYGSTGHIGDNEGLDSLTDVNVGGTVRKLVAGNQHTCALLETGYMRCWGLNSSGQLGYGNTTNHVGDNETPASAGDISTGAQVTAITAGGVHSCALLSDGQLKCWGEGSRGRLGYGSNQNDHSSPPDNGVDLDDVSAYQLSAGNQHTCALRSNGTARCWGYGNSGRLGYGDQSNIYTPSDAGDIQIFAP